MGIMGILRAIIKWLKNKSNCLVNDYSENPADFPLVRSIFSKLVTHSRNYPYINRCALLK